MKGASIEKEVKEEIDELLELKRKYKSRSGKDYESSATWWYQTNPGVWKFDFLQLVAMYSATVYVILRSYFTKYKRSAITITILLKIKVEVEYMYLYNNNIIYY